MEQLKKTMSPEEAMARASAMIAQQSSEDLYKGLTIQQAAQHVRKLHEANVAGRTGQGIEPLVEPTQNTDKDVAFVMLPTIMCPECGYHLNAIRRDNIQMEIHHGVNINCSRSATFVVRPIAHFVKFI